MPGPAHCQRRAEPEVITFDPPVEPMLAVPVVDLPVPTRVGDLAYELKWDGWLH
jgi:hypothetical protein